MVAQPRKFFKNCTIWHYLKNISTNILRCLLHAKLLNLKTFKDFSFMQNQRLLKTFGRHYFFKDLNKNCDMMSLFLKTFHGLHIFKDF